ncbi:MAG: STAS domain-containing protein [Cyanobacteriota bacterium]
MTSATANEFQLINDTYVLDLNDSSFNITDSRVLEIIVCNLIKENHVEKIAFNMTNVNYMNTAALGTLLTIYNICQKEDIEFKVYNLTEFIQELFVTTHVIDVIKAVKSI